MLIFAFMKQALKHIGMIIFMLVFCCALYAQRFVNATLNGAQTVYSIMQDNDGLLWVGTENGLYSYDGYHSFKHYADLSESNVRINAIGQNSNMLYMATGKSRLAFDLNTYSYKAIADAQHGYANAKAEQRVIDARCMTAVYGSDVYALLHANDALLVGTISGLYKVKGHNDASAKGNNAASRCAAGTAKQQIFICEGAQPLVNALAYDARRQCYWIGTEGALYCADRKLKNFSKIAALNGNSIKCLAQEPNGTLYIGTDNGLYAMTMGGDITHYAHDSRDAATIPNNIVWACYVDKWQNVWIGTDNGLARLSAHSYYAYTALDKLTLSGEGNCLHELCQTRDGEWWMGGTNGLIRQNHIWYRQDNAQYALSHNRVRKIYEDRDGDVWVCTDHGINLLDRRTQQMQNVIVADRTGKYSTAWAYDVLLDKSGRLWMAAYMGGIFVVDKHRVMQEVAKTRAKAPRHATCMVADIHLQHQGANALAGLHVGQMAMDAQGFVWATADNKLDRINTANMKVTHVAGNEAVNYIMADAKGNVWVGSNGSVKRYTPAVGKGEPHVKEWKIGRKAIAMCDVKGATWVLTGKECCVIGTNGTTFRFKIPTSLIPSTMYYSPRQHQVVMGGNDGYVALRADVPTLKGNGDKLMLTGIEVNGKPLLSSDNLSDAHNKQWAVVKKNLLAPRLLKKLELKSNENSVVLHLTDLPFANAPASVYAYMLEGSDHEWRYVDACNLDVEYNGLPYGDYRLTIRTVDAVGNVGDEVYALDICILPPWYLTVWAKLVYLLLAMAVAWGAMRFYLVRQRLLEERRQKKEILEQVEARIGFFNRLAHDLKAAVEHRSFDEVLQLTSRYLGMPTKPVETKVKEQPLRDSDMKLLNAINEAIEQHIVDSDFNVTTLQEVVGMGSKQLYRKLKAMTGKTPVEYIRDIRMHKASMLLKEGKFSVSEVMYMVGFSNSSYFSKCFSKAFGMTPTEYMKN